MKTRIDKMIDRNTNVQITDEALAFANILLAAVFRQPIT